MARGRRKRIIQSHDEYLSEEVVGQKCNQKSVTSSALYPCTEEDQLASENENEELAPARNGCLCTLSFKDWRVLIGKKERSTNEQKNKEDILKQVKKRFLYPARMEKWVLRTIEEKWRQHKSNLKSMYFDPHKSNEANISNVPEGVTADQWIALVNNWMTLKAQDLSEANRVNCGKRNAKHTAGPRTFARNREELECLDDLRSMQIDVQTTSKWKRVYGATRSKEFELHNIQDSTRSEQNDDEYEDMEPRDKYSCTIAKRKVPNDRDGNLLRANRVPTPYKAQPKELHIYNTLNNKCTNDSKGVNQETTFINSSNEESRYQGMNQETSSNFSTHEEYIYQHGAARRHPTIQSWLALMVTLRARQIQIGKLP